MKKFFEELSRRLREGGVESSNVEDRRLEIFLHGQPVLFVSPGNDVFLFPAGSNNPEASELYHRVAQTADEVYTYVEEVQTAPTLHISGLSEKFHLLADFGGAVLAGRELENGRGYQFVTWIWDYNRTGVSYGHYYDEDFCGAKQDFAVRSGLISKTQLFSPEELTELYDNDKTAVLNLPAADAGIWRAVEKVDAASVDECAFRCVDCLIPFLRDAINNAIDDEDGIEQADEFAKRLAQIEREWPESDMVKYKALLSVVDHPSLQDATRLMGEIDQYELRPEVAQTWGYAEMMFREKYSALPEELFQTPQAAQIGQKMLDDRLGVITEYGLIRRKDGQPLPVFQPEQEIGQGLEMM